jgi:hypothetical protein
MPTWLKPVSIVIGVTVLGGTAVALDVFFWQPAQARLAESKAAIRDGAKFGDGVDAPACMGEAVARVKNAGHTQALMVRLFLTSCLKVAKPVARFCDDVPAKTDRKRTASWKLKMNQTYGLNPPDETDVVLAIQFTCEARSFGFAEIPPVRRRVGETFQPDARTRVPT